jgi:hypothetical protein
MAQQLGNIMGCFQYRHCQRNQTVVAMTQGRAKEPHVTREKCYLLSLVQKPKNLLLIVPLGPAYFKSDLTKVNSAMTKLFCLVFGDVVVQYDHAAVLGRAGISLTIPLRVNANASRTPFAVMMPRYWRAIASGVYPDAVNSSASETSIRVPLNIKRPPQTRLSAAKCLPISIRAMSFLPPWQSLYQLHSPIKSFARRIAKRLTALKAAKQIGLTIPLGVVPRADRVIK